MLDLPLLLTAVPAKDWLASSYVAAVTVVFWSPVQTRMVGNKFRGRHDVDASL